ncbi:MULTISPECIES: hypothetical protein [Saccharibacillus]|uniref:hypothetical protein n=1 Tax=Saccharibacillus TaxID=456492 RepID=UPI001239043F|nr:hypothetical protein [Saccharibacillus sp. WB 17]MWJ30667.1 hypothetical protein [Saccharibacillus sp. WB 17]
MKRTRRLAVSVLVCLSVAAAALTASAAASIKVYRNGTEVVTEASPRFVEGQVMIPLSLAGELFDQDMDYDSVQRVLNVDSRTGEIAKSADGKLAVTGTAALNGMWDGLMLRSGDRVVGVPGKTLGPDSPYPPEFAAAPLTGGPAADVVILLTQGYGTGLYVNEAFVYTAELEPVALEDALVSMRKQTRAGFRPDGSVFVETGGQSTAIAAQRLLTDRGNPGEAPTFGGVVRYAVEDGRLTATAGVQVGSSEFIGDLKLVYTYANGVLQAGTPRFTAYDEYR